MNGEGHEYQILYSQFDQDQYDKMHIHGKVKLHHFIADYDTINLQSRLADVLSACPIRRASCMILLRWISIRRLDVTAGKDITAVLNDLSLLLATNNLWLMIYPCPWWEFSIRSLICCYG